MGEEGFVEHFKMCIRDRVCSVCGSELVEIGVEIHRSLQMKPAEFWVREDRYPTYACKHCEKERCV